MDSNVIEDQLLTADAVYPQAELNLIGYADRLSDGGRVSGWVFDKTKLMAAVRLHVVIDGQELTTMLADELREDVRAALGHPTGAVGFNFQIPGVYLDGQQHTLSLRFSGGAALNFLDQNDPSLSRSFTTFQIKLPPQITGNVDGLREGKIHGWVTRKEPSNTMADGGCHILVTCDGARVAQLRADRYRGDVAAATGGDPNCGFQLSVPTAFRSTTPREFRFLVMPEEIEVPGSPLVTSTVEDRLEGTLLEISEQMDALFREFVQLRRRVGEILPQPGFNLADYDRWARAYYPALTARVKADRLVREATMQGLSDPLVSVLLPTYRPLLSDFRAAVESVLAQSYSNWELIIVDDCSKEPELSALIEEFCAQDSRIRSITRQKNGNISEATNTAIKASKGDWAAFFDHDDLLVDVALELMVRAAQRTEARVLYSDEDKIDQAGYYLEPNFKPDWNYRYLLGCNYVCHLLFVDRQTLAEVGPLRSKYNGAQDHDLILRLAELVPSSAFHHVPEVLYHWRKTPNSTAADLSKKDYAKVAGVKAVSDHLRRRGLKADVQTVRGLTLYNPVWQFTETPNICIIIPFKDQIETTRKCLEAVLYDTDYPSIEVVLVDNWSMTSEAVEFVEEAQRDERVRVMRVEEGFNFSRLNNLAAATTNAEYLLFLNNDLYPSTSNWLRLLVNEALAGTDVGAVGGRFLYPNETIQHAGLVVGPNGLAAHVHRGSPVTDYGFIGRIVLAHELTAVTAACMLVRADIFHQVGGFDEVGLKVAFNDVDLCLRIRAAGYRIIYCAEMLAIHHESLSRGSDTAADQELRFFQEQQTLLERWGDNPLFLQDPAYNPHFTVDRQTFFDLRPPK